MSINLKRQSEHSGLHLECLYGVWKDNFQNNDVRGDDLYGLVG